MLNSQQVWVNPLKLGTPVREVRHWQGPLFRGPWSHESRYEPIGAIIEAPSGRLFKVTRKGLRRVSLKEHFKRYRRHEKILRDMLENWPAPTWSKVLWLGFFAAALTWTLVYLWS